jgi:hypothetical protein
VDGPPRYAVRARASVQVAGGTAFERKSGVPSQTRETTELDEQES